ncbi:DUF4123 domain-containing protein [Loktanella sp. F6476L]|uniref:DUF4123 domain-containing protein n=1 Tax=Loktanella sp. F6476L TaxID=2926405 RepID=UPI001FF61AB7|nr:DUF4123 domain-containing protein [Loktanella sp. F6476L]MCK0122444.1 DUF4123 domain-containing protein [Loktanella sp. F6476L]
MLVETQTLRVKPLDLQMGASTLLTVPSALEEVLFGDDALQTYAIVDAASLPGFDSPDAAGGLLAACLFKGAPAEDLADCAPYLIALEPDHSFTRALFTRSEQPWHYWDRNAVILVQTTAPFELVRDHFRRFTKIPDDTGAWFFLRFFMPQAMDAIIDGLSQSAGHLRRWFAIGREQQVFRYIVPRPDLDVVHSYKPLQTLMQDKGAVAPYRLDAQYVMILERIRDLRLEGRLMSAITYDYANVQNLSADQIRQIVKDSIQAARAEGLKTELAIGQFAAAGFIMGQVMTPAHLSRVAGYLDRSRHENMRTKALLSFAETVILQRAKEAV